MILITGGLGFIGKHTARAVLDLGEKCVLAQRGAGEIPGAITHRVDITDRTAVLDIGQRYPITGIIHLAGAFLQVTDPIEAARRETQSLLTVLEAAREWQVPRASIASTIGVYGGIPAPPPWREDLPLAMAAGHTIPAFKKVGELLTDLMAATGETELLSLRIGAIWGPGGRPASSFLAAPGLVHAAVRGTPPPTVYAANGTDLCYVRDCGRAIALLQLAGPLRHRVYNVSAGTATTNGEIVAALRVVVPDARFDVLAGRDPNGPDEDPYLDITRLREDTGFTPEFDADRAVADYADWLRAGHER